jgi:hypothetical protein
MNSSFAIIATQSRVNGYRPFSHSSTSPASSRYPPGGYRDGLAASIPICGPRPRAQAHKPSARAGDDAKTPTWRSSSEPLPRGARRYFAGKGDHLERTKTSRARTVPTSAQASEVVIEIEVVLDRGVDGGEFNFNQFKIAAPLLDLRRRPPRLVQNRGGPPQGGA